MKKIIISSFAVLSLISCRTDFETNLSEVTPTNGEADFSTYVALGNSLTSGYRDNALYIDAQKESYPNIIATQMKAAGGGDFTQPLMPDNIGGFSNLGVAGKMTLKLENGALTPVATTAESALTTVSGSFNNMGVPGAKSFHLLAAGYGNAAGIALGRSNPYFVRFASSATTSVLADAMAKKPTFFSLWIGNNDVLSYATSGGAGTDQTGNPNPATYGSNDITDPQVLAASIKAVLDGMKSVGATKGVIANIPDVTTIPFFTTVPSKPISGLTSVQVTALNTAYAEYNKGLAQIKALGAITEAEYQQRLISFSETGSNGAVIIDSDLTNLSAYKIPSYRQTTSEDYILLTSLSAIRSGGGTQTALTNAQVLTQKEVAKIATATAAYNAAIKSLADAYGLAFVDANAKMKELSSGMIFNGTAYTATFVSGGAFSLDGVHLTGRGYAVIANEFIKAINSTYGSTLRQVNPNRYSGVTFP
ncbi:G-D-S-L family lipolytic protein [Bergeyella porcorum]|uniref:G-D-S-L family lipolytic protein n=1 Tax=Bergeyella porcorum TaxID=1735111 RepID=UPI0035F07F21